MIRAYSDLYFKFRDPQAQYQGTDSWLNMTPNQVEVLLS